MADIKLLVIGTGGVGKSACSLRLVQNKFSDSYDPTIEDSYRKDLKVDGETSKLQILDTSGQDDYSAMVDTYCRSGEGFLCVYSINSKQSFQEVVKFHARILKAKGSKWEPVVLIGNKKDLERKERKVTHDEGKALADKWNASFFETSAKTGEMVEESFAELVRLVRTHRERRKKKKLKKDKGGFFDKCTIL